MLYHNNSDDNFVPNLTGLADEVTTACTMIRKARAKFDGIVVRGMSGVIPGTPVSLKLKVPMVVVRKPSDDRHATEPTINGSEVYAGSRWLFLDDFVIGGSTRWAVHEQIEKMGGKVIGQYTTRDNDLHFYGEPTAFTDPFASNPDTDIPF